MPTISAVKMEQFVQQHLAWIKIVTAGMTPSQASAFLSRLRYLQAVPPK